MSCLLSDLLYILDAFLLSERGEAGLDATGHGLRGGLLHPRDELADLGELDGGIRRPESNGDRAGDIMRYPLLAEFVIHGSRPLLIPVFGTSSGGACGVAESGGSGYGHDLFGRDHLRADLSSDSGSGASSHSALQSELITRHDAIDHSRQHLRGSEHAFGEPVATLERACRWVELTLDLIVVHLSRHRAVGELVIDGLLAAKAPALLDLLKERRL